MKIKPCPFCGAQPTTASPLMKNGFKMSFSCPECEASGPGKYMEGIDPEFWRINTIEAWNERKLEAGLFNAIKHGDEDHQKWLKEKIEHYFQGETQ